MKGAQSKPNPLPNAFPKLFEWNFERKILMKSPEPGNKAQRKVEKLKYELIYQSRVKCEIYRDTGVSKNNNFAIRNSKL